jgi:hypothetical protein
LLAGRKFSKQETMNQTKQESCTCCEESDFSPVDSAFVGILPAVDQAQREEPCCGSPAGPAASAFEQPGYQLCSFVDGFIKSDAAIVPRIKTKLGCDDIVGTIRTRCGVGRSNYRVAPGMYAVGSPDRESPVFVSANYKLSFDALRKELTQIDAWILVLDTRGVNVWCAAGKGTFSTRELVDRIARVKLDLFVGHKKVVVPQLAATGVAARDVQKQSGFEVVWGPVRAADLEAFMQNGARAEERMRRVTFSLAERIVLIPVEIALLWKKAAILVTALFFLSGFGEGIYSLTAVWERGTVAVFAVAVGVAAGVIVMPVLLPWLPATSFAAKGFMAGALVGIPVIAGSGFNSGLGGAVALLLFILSLSSFLAMNFTGSTPFTSPSGVEKEMRRYMPVQAAMAVIGLILWL